MPHQQRIEYSGAIYHLIRAGDERKDICMRILTVIILVGAIGCSKYTAYVPAKLVVKRGDHSYVQDPSLTSVELIAAMTNVLVRYGEDYRIKDGVLLIRSRLARDRELVANYTEKALALQDAGMVDRSVKILRPPAQSEKK